MWYYGMFIGRSNAARLLLVVVAAWLGGGWRLSAHAFAEEDVAHTVILNRVDFNRDVRPILSDKCFFCHGPDGEQLQAGLRLDDFKIATSELDSGSIAIVPGKPDESEIIYRIESTDEDQRMPPAEAKLPPLSAADKTLIRRWIGQGAKWEDHWSLVPLKEMPLPRVDDERWPQNPIDRFVLARLEAEQLTPAPEARKETLLRRVSFDLTGLPPTPNEVDAFLNNTSPDAYEKVVDRLLASPRYGEHVAVHWLDLARYSDTYGYQVDRDRRVWPWRDWVIHALNDNMPYDEFITLQLAGDLLPEATDEQILATTFNRLHSQKAEGGSTEEEFRVEYVADRVQTFGTTFLGLTLQCARCHDHKFDAVTQKEFYQLFAFFDNVDEFGLYSYFTPAVPTPTLLLASEEQKRQMARGKSQIAAAEARLADVSKERHSEFEAWLVNHAEDETIPGLVARFDFEKYHKGKLPASTADVPPAKSSAENQIVKGHHGNAIRLTGDDEVKTQVGNFTRNDPFSVSLWLSTPDVKERAVVYHRSQAWTDSGSQGYELLIEDGRLKASLIHFWPGNACSIRTLEKIKTLEWLHVTVTYDGSSRAGGLMIYVNGRPQKCEVVRDLLTKKITGKKPHITIGARFRDRGFKGGMVDEFQVFDRQLVPLEVTQLADSEIDGATLAQLLAKPSSELSTTEKQSLYEVYLAAVDPQSDEHRQQLRKLRIQRSKLTDNIPEIMVMRELDQPRQTHLLRRGLYSDPGETVSAETPQALPAMPSDLPHNRLGLAKWLTDPGHPLTARVAVNRFWQMCFGEGLVRTPEDFGSQGEPPTHPKLLDWLSKDFIDSCWDVKRLMKQIVTSATYRQTSTIDTTLRTLDPTNRLLARGPQRRLPAEAIRDNGLFVSGLLVEKIGGPPVVPYEITESFKPRKRSKGEGLYRRSLYTHWRQTGPAPVMEVFDASRRDVCVAKREVTSTPLQALVLLNDPQIIELSRVFAERLIVEMVIVETLKDDQQMFEQMFFWLTSRRPDAKQLAVITAMFEEQLAYFTKHPTRAEEYLSIGDTPRNKSIAAPRLAAVAVVAAALFNYDECIIQR